MTIILKATLSQQNPSEVRIDLATMGDVNPAGWVPGQTATGPSFFASVVRDGAFPAKPPQDLIDAVGFAIRRAVETELAVWALRNS